MGVTQQQRAGRSRAQRAGLAPSRPPSLPRLITRDARSPPKAGACPDLMPCWERTLRAARCPGPQHHPARGGGILLGLVEIGWGWAVVLE